jgi:hypothetical protein
MLRPMQPRIELLWWDGCPSTGRALADLRAALAELGLDPDAVQMHEIATDEQAEAEAFPGSPTIRIDGADAFPTAGAVGLACRVYRLADGRPSPTPDPAHLRAALAERLEAA